MTWNDPISLRRAMSRSMSPTLAAVGALRDAAGCRLAPRHDAGLFGPPVRDVGEGAAPNNTPELTSDHTLRLLTAALDELHLRLARSISLVNYHLRRNETASEIARQGRAGQTQKRQIPAAVKPLTGRFGLSNLLLVMPAWWRRTTWSLASGCAGLRRRGQTEKLEVDHLVVPRIYPVHAVRVVASQAKARRPACRARRPDGAAVLCRGGRGPSPDGRCRQRARGLRRRATPPRAARAARPPARSSR